MFKIYWSWQLEILALIQRRAQRFEFRSFDIRICFGFRNSDFGFDFDIGRIKIIYRSKKVAGYLRRVQDTASDKIVWILSRRLQLSAHLGKIFFRTHFLQGLFTRYPISKSYLNLKFFLAIRLFVLFPPQKEDSDSIFIFYYQQQKNIKKISHFFAKRQTKDRILTTRLIISQV